MRRVILLAAIMLCSGCALTTAHIDVPYQPVAAPSPVTLPAAGGAVAQVETTDARTTNRDRVGTKKNGYGMEMAPIVASNDLPQTVSAAFRQELAARGFRIAANGAVVHVDLVRFYNDFKSGFFSGDAVATVAFNLKVVSPGGTMTFSKYYAGNGVEPNIQIAGGDNARAALVKAFGSSVRSVMADPDFLQALRLAALPPAPRLAALQSAP